MRQESRIVYLVNIHVHVACTHYIHTSSKQSLVYRAEKLFAVLTAFIRVECLRGLGLRLRPRLLPQRCQMPSCDHGSLSKFSHIRVGLQPCSSAQQPCSSADARMAAAMQLGGRAVSFEYGLACSSADARMTAAMQLGGRAHGPP